MVQSLQSLRAGRFCGRIFVALLLGAMALAARGAESAPDWKVVSKSGDVTIYEREHPGSDLREFKGVGTFPVAPVVAFRALEDVKEYPHFMPYVVEARIISQGAHSRVTYQRISPPVVGDRDYTVRVDQETRQEQGGLAYISRWQTANELGPAEKAGVVRVKVTKGSWVLAPGNGGRETQATYTVFSDCGGSIPSMIFNATGKSAVAKVFAALRSQAKLAKYAGE
jgi:hypothetical protein